MSWIVATTIVMTRLVWTERDHTWYQVIPLQKRHVEPSQTLVRLWEHLALPLPPVARRFYVKIARVDVPHDQADVLLKADGDCVYACFLREHEVSSTADVYRVASYIAMVSKFIYSIANIITYSTAKQ